MYAPQNQYECIDLSDNQIQILDNFAQLDKLTTLLLNNNLVSRVGATIGTQLPNLDSLILTNCRIANLAIIDNIASLKKLRILPSTTRATLPPAPPPPPLCRAAPLLAAPAAGPARTAAAVLQHVWCDACVLRAWLVVYVLSLPAQAVALAGSFTPHHRAKSKPCPEHLSLVKNPVTRVKNYRLYTIHKLPSLLTLDFTRVKKKVRV